MAELGSAFSGSIDLILPSAAAAHSRGSCTALYSHHRSQPSQHCSRWQVQLKIISIFCRKASYCSCARLGPATLLAPRKPQTRYIKAARARHTKPWDNWAALWGCRPMGRQNWTELPTGDLSAYREHRSSPARRTKKLLQHKFILVWKCIKYVCHRCMEESTRQPPRPPLWSCRCCIPPPPFLAD